MSRNLKIVDMWLSETGAISFGRNEAGMSAYVIETCILDARDRCDACGSQAFVEVVLNHSKRLRHGGMLQLCSHHATQYLDAMDPYIHYIHDERYRLTA